MIDVVKYLSTNQIIPNLNTNGIPVNYTVTKREVVINGGTSVFKKIIKLQ